MPVTLSDAKLKLKFVDATDMENITYTYPGYDEVTITGTLMISVEKDYHRLYDGTKAHMIPPTWIHMEWDVKDGGTAFKI